jgi:DNA-binding response OmpR family regulator
MRILIVDDEPMVARTIELIFNKHGFDSETASSADAALAAARANPPDIVLCDIDMPGRDGISLMKDLGREMPGCPIVVLTGHYPLLDRVSECANSLSQSVSVVIKPCQPVELLKTAGSMLRSA